ncbi:MAG: glycosyltransferase [Deltaproteobacteria bacterium]|nr:glycosyltransferase [Deltaproteobacteria bacterium]
MPQAPRVVAILPTYNEAENIGPLCEHLMGITPRVDVCIVDDDSPDGTGEVVQRLTRAYPTRVFCECRTRRFGRGNAVMHGFRFALAHGYEYAIEMDADFSHDPAAIPALLAAAMDADLVVGSRHLPGGGFRGWNWRRRAVHAVACWYARGLFGMPTTDHTNGFRCYRVACLEQLPLEAAMASGFVGQTMRAVLFHAHGLRIREIPVIFHERRAGRSKMSVGEALRGAWALLKYRCIQ